MTPPRSNTPLKTTFRQRVLRSCVARNARPLSKDGIFESLPVIRFQNARQRIEESKLQIANRKSQISECNLPILDPQSSISSPRLKSSAVSGHHSYADQDVKQNEYQYDRAAAKHPHLLMYI